MIKHIDKIPRPGKGKLPTAEELGEANHCAQTVVDVTWGVEPFPHHKDLESVNS